MNAVNLRWLFRIGVGPGRRAVLAIQLVPHGRDHTNPPSRSEPPWDSRTTRALAKQACFDCHTNETTWPTYASIAPASERYQRESGVCAVRAVLAPGRRTTFSISTTAKTTLARSVASIKSPTDSGSVSNRRLNRGT